MPACGLGSLLFVLVFVLGGGEGRGGLCGECGVEGPVFFFGGVRSSQGWLGPVPPSHTHTDTHLHVCMCVLPSPRLSSHLISSHDRPPTHPPHISTPPRSLMMTPTTGEVPAGVGGGAQGA